MRVLATLTVHAFACALGCTAGADESPNYTTAEAATLDDEADTSGEPESSSSDSDSGSTSSSTDSTSSETTDTSSETGTTCTSDGDCIGAPQGELCHEGACVLCIPGTIEPCYTGPADTIGQGTCVGGTQTCVAEGSGFAACEGEVVPVTELCGNQLDDDCNGTIDDNLDLDNDGWGACDGDCCDILSGNCSDPALVNPGAYEVAGNLVDDDCDGIEDEPTPACDANLIETSTDPDDFAMAMELCQFTTLAPPLADKVWGVIDAQVKLPNGQPLGHWEQVGIPANFGPNQPPANDAMVVLSSGWASDTAASAEWGKGWGVVQQAPAPWLAFHGGYLPKNPGCGQNGSTIRDPAMLELKIRAPTNAQSFEVDLDFFNAEYPEWVCGQYQDMFVALIDSQSLLNPADGNVAIYDDGQAQYPIGVNLARDSGLFRQCAPNSSFGCQGSGGTLVSSSCEGVDQLIGTPYGANDPGCGGGHTYSGGATDWLTMTGNVVPGEVFTIKLFVFDAGENGSGLADALVLLDNWRWNLEASAPGVNPQ